VPRDEESPMPSSLLRRTPAEGGQVGKRRTSAACTEANEHFEVFSSSAPHRPSAFQRSAGVFTGKVAAVLVGLTVLAGCASTQLVGNWKDPNYTARAKKILVLGMARTEGIKAQYENTLSATLKAEGVDAVPAGQLVPHDGEVKKEDIRAAIEGQGFDAVLVTRLVAERQEQRYIPGTPYVAPHPYYHGFYDYYMSTYPMVYGPGYLVNDRIVNLETNVYETQQGKLIWAVTSETFNPENINREIASLAKLITQQMKKDGVI
jgi:hypothetical protein